MAAFAKPKSTGTKLTASEEKNSNGSVIWNNPMRKTKSRFAICINNREYPASLELHKLYRILPDKDAQADGDLRIIDESGEDYLFPADYFILVDLPQTTVRALNQSFSQAPAQA
jgi:hypothetical protein